MRSPMDTFHNLSDTVPVTFVYAGSAVWRQVKEVDGVKNGGRVSTLRSSTGAKMFVNPSSCIFETVSITRELALRSYIGV